MVVAAAALMAAALAGCGGAQLGSPGNNFVSSPTGVSSPYQTYQATPMVPSFGTPPVAQPAPAPDLWHATRLRGANVDLDRATLDDLKVLRSWGANHIRLVLFGKLMEKEPPYALREADFAALSRALDACQTLGLHAVIELHTCPGRDQLEDLRIWRDAKYQDQLERLWREIARRCRSRGDVVAGYDLLNEPNPEDLFGGKHDEAAIRGTPADWNALAKRLTKGIRQVDRQHTIIVESSAWAYARGFAWLQPTGDRNTVYSFHMYTPHKFTHQEAGGPPVLYPGDAPAHVEPAGYWDKAALEKNLQPVVDFQKKHRAVIYCGEFGCRRFAPDGSAARYYKDLLDIFEAHKWHWAYWAFRESPMWDLELGTDPASRTRDAEKSELVKLVRSYMAPTAAASRQGGR